MIKQEILLLLLLFKASYAKYSAAFCGSSMYRMRRTASWSFITWIKKTKILFWLSLYAHKKYVGNMAGGGSVKKCIRTDRSPPICQCLLRWQIQYLNQFFQHQQQGPSLWIAECRLLCPNICVLDAQIQKLLSFCFPSRTRYLSKLIKRNAI